MVRFAHFVSPILLLLALASQAIAHPFHICVGQMRWNGEEKYWELSLRLHPQDLEQSMQRWRLAKSDKDLSQGQLVEALLAGCRIEDPDFESNVVPFLDQHFFLYTCDPSETRSQEKALRESLSAVTTQHAKNKSRLVWVGKEYEKAWVWLHMELHPPQVSSHESQTRLCHKVLLGEIPEQENSILIETGQGQRFSLQFKGEEYSKALEPETGTTAEAVVTPTTTVP